MGLLGLAGSLLGMIPKVGSPKGAKKGKSGGSKGKSTKKSSKKSTKKKGSTKKKQRKPSKKKKKKRKKKWGKFFTKARKLKNSLSKSKLVKRVKKAVKKAVLATKKTAKKAAKAAKKATKAAVQTVKKAATVAVKASKKITGGTVAKVVSAYSSFKEGGWKEAVSVAVDFIPVVGNAKALYESVSGKDPITGRKLGKTERLVSAGAVLLGPAAKAVKHGGKAVTKMVSGGSKGKTNPTSLTKPKEQVAKQEPSKTKPSQQAPSNKQQTVPVAGTSNKSATKPQSTAQPKTNSSQQKPTNKQQTIPVAGTNNKSATKPQSTSQPKTKPSQQAPINKQQTTPIVGTGNKSAANQQSTTNKKQINSSPSNSKSKTNNILDNKTRVLENIQESKNARTASNFNDYIKKEKEILADKDKTKNIDFDNFNFGKYLKKHIGDPPKNMYDPHAHHILFKKGLKEAQQKLVKEGQEILREFDIDPIFGLENLVWAPNRVKGQHGIDALKNVVDKIKQVKHTGGDRDDMVETLKELGQIAAQRR